ncbi:MAG: acyltransferase [Nocardioidaceae bacterium]|nr:acyltransferase [Nocardioidaceae bacterium]
MRGVAILLVLFGHGFQNYKVGPAAAAGVTLFFVLSGYLITGILLDRPSLRTFYARRLTRLAPPLFVMVLVVLIVGGISWTHAIGALTWTQNYTEYHIDTWPFGVTWSLGVEEQFYLLWPLFLLAVPRRHLSRSLVILFAALMAWRMWRAFGGDLIQSYTSVECAGTAMVAGAYVRARSVQLSAGAGSMGIYVLVCLIGATCAIGSVAWLALPIFATVPCAMLVASHESLSRWLARPWLVWCGITSYSMYLWHDTLPSLFDAETLPWGVAVGALVGVVAYYAVERPVMRWRSRSHRVEVRVRPGVGELGGVVRGPRHIDSTGLKDVRSAGPVPVKAE